MRFGFFLFTLAILPVFSQDYNFGGQASGWFNLGDGSFSDNEWGLRYIPEFSAGKDLGASRTLDLELALNGFTAGTVDDPFETDDLKLYRGWLRYATPRFEVRAGLQKINFGPATLLRALRWFDRIDPRDPLKLTEGVYGLLGRFYFERNANLWVWGLYGNDEVKGLEVLPTEKNSIEYGARYQHPAGDRGELAVTWHHRTTDPAAFLALPPGFPSLPTKDEDRFALDGRWDLTLGVWFEAVLSRRERGGLPYPYQRFLTVGADYTFPLANGLLVMAEHLTFAAAENPLVSGEAGDVTALSMSYPFGLSDRLFAVVNYDWTNHQTITYLSWGRSYDRWGFYVNAYDNPETQVLLPGDMARDSFGAGKGIQLLVTFNH